MKVIMDNPVAYFITWTTYGTWLPGDQRGWVERGTWEVRPPDPERKRLARELMTDEAVVLSPDQRRVVDAALVDHCRIRNWTLHARNVRTNHVHVVVTADVHPTVVREQLKAWASRRLSEHAGLFRVAGKDGRRRWWTEKGDIELVPDEERLVQAVHYVLELQ
jgi:REP element-mobilizing transposase RayT